jgi:hypothetical protein
MSAASIWYSKLRNITVSYVDMNILHNWIKAHLYKHVLVVQDVPWAGDSHNFLGSTNSVSYSKPIGTHSDPSEASLHNIPLRCMFTGVLICP